MPTMRSPLRPTSREHSHAPGFPLRRGARRLSSALARARGSLPAGLFPRGCGVNSEVPVCNQAFSSRHALPCELVRLAFLDVVHCRVLRKLSLHALAPRNHTLPGKAETQTVMCYRGRASFRHAGQGQVMSKANGYGALAQAAGDCARNDVDDERSGPTTAP